MSQVTTNTQIDTINVLTEISSLSTGDLVLIQRGSVSHKIKKENISLNVGQLQSISDYVVLGQISGGGAAEEISVLKSTDGASSVETALVTEKRIKDYIAAEIATGLATIDLDGVAKGWAKVDADGTLLKGFNVASSSNTSDVYKVTWTTPFADANYAVHITFDGNKTESTAQIYEQTTTYVTFGSVTDSGNWKNAPHHIVAFSD
jgi:hypothetical protein